MKKIIFKINGFDEQSNSLIISFASDETKSSNPSDYQSYAYQPITTWPDVSDIEELKKRIAQAGVYMAEQQKIKEEFVLDTKRIEDLKSMVGKTFEYSIDSIIPPPSSNLQTSEYTNEVDA